MSLKKSNEEEQLKEIAAGLENSVICSSGLLGIHHPKPKGGDDESNRILASGEPDLNILLPRVSWRMESQGRGFVVKSRVPQVAVLSHDLLMVS